MALDLQTQGPPVKPSALAHSASTLVETNRVLHSVRLHGPAKLTSA